MYLLCFSIDSTNWIVNPGYKASNLDIYYFLDVHSHFGYIFPSLFIH